MMTNITRTRDSVNRVIGYAHRGYLLLIPECTERESQDLALRRRHYMDEVRCTWMMVLVMSF